jgi:hypothetical protein
MYSIMKRTLTSKYQKVYQSLSQSEANDFVIDASQPRIRFNPWMVSTVILGALSAALYLKSWTDAKLGGYHSGFTTDFGKLNSHLQNLI